MAKSKDFLCPLVFGVFFFFSFLRAPVTISNHASLLTVFFNHTVCHSLRQCMSSKGSEHGANSIDMFEQMNKYIYLLSFSNFLKLLSCLCPALKWFLWRVNVSPLFWTPCFLRHFHQHLSFKPKIKQIYSLHSYLFLSHLYDQTGTSKTGKSICYSH